MAAQISQFSRVASADVRLDRGSCAFCGAPFSVITTKSRASARIPRNPLPSWHITNRGELYGAKDTDGG